MAQVRGVLSAATVIGLVIGGGVAPPSARADVAPRRTTTTQKRSVVHAPKKVEPRRPVVVAPPAPTENAVLVHYQRIGRELFRLQQLRGTECTLDLWPRFRAIKLEQDTATPEARIAMAAMLTEIQHKIERKRGITIRQECLDNPLAAECL
jgi:hypothetical protein